MLVPVRVRGPVQGLVRVPAWVLVPVQVQGLALGRVLGLAQAQVPVPGRVLGPVPPWERRLQAAE